MSDQERSANTKRMPARDFQRPERAQPAPPLDTAKAVGELNRFLDLVIQEMRLEIERDVSVAQSTEPGAHDSDVVVTFQGPDQDLLLERNGELLLALEHIGHRWLRLDPRLHDRVRFDCGDYRATRLAELKLSARVAAQRVRETGEAFRFNPMSSRERRIVHLELNGAPGVRTMSDGSGDRRQLVIYPATKKSPRGALP
jgi:spoIIIJ-associated protein